MKRKLYTIVGVLALTISGFYLLESKTEYTPRVIKSLFSDDEYDNEEAEERGIKGAVEEVYSLKANQITGTIDYQDIANARAATNVASMRRVGKKLVWEELGPDNQGGRTRAILIDKNDPNVMYMGSVSGGLFKSTTRGTSWNPVGNQLFNLNVSSLTQTANNAIYYGTGEDGFLSGVSIQGDKNGTPGFAGNGVYKSIDGVTFTHLTSTNPAGGIWTNVHRLASDPTSDVVYAANDGGFYYSETGGNTWVRPVGQIGAVREVVVSKTGVVYISIGASVYKSTDKGKTITKTGFNVTGNSPSINVGRATLAISTQDENYIYALVAKNNGAMEGLFRSTDAGANWVLLVPGGVNNDIFGSNTQGIYDNCVTVDPLNKERVFLGGVLLAEWTNTKGFNFIGSIFAARTSPSYVHADKHVFTWDETVNPPIMFIGTDGGMFRCANTNANNFNYTFSAQSRGFITTQYFGLAAAEDGTVMGGTQDNSNQLINGNGNTPKSAVELFSGDGFQNEIARQNPKMLFLESQYGNLARSIDGGVSFADIWDGRIGGATRSVATSASFAPFDCQFRLWEDMTDSSNSKLYYAPYNSVWAAVGPLSTTDRPTWFIVSNQGGGASQSSRITNITPSANGDNLFYAMQGGGLFRVDSINSASFDTAIYPLSTDIPTPLVTRNIRGNLPSGRAITSISIDPNNPNRAIVTLGNYGNSSYVYLSNNILSLSPTFTDITGNLPKMPVFDGLILIDNPNYFIIATEFGIWASDDNGTTWENQTNGMPNVASYIIRQYEFKPWKGPQIYVATHGRGFFKANTFLTHLEKPKATLSNVAIAVYPNPTTERLNVNFETTSEGNMTYTIYSLQGQQVSKTVEKVEAGIVKKQLDVSFLAKGTYILSVGDGANKKAIKFVVN